MDPEPTEEQRSVEEVRKSVEIVVKTDAEAGASGYSVTGGQQGIFVKDVLKDSPAAKHLSLKEGDQLLSAKVYFENVKYEDALKILQCAEPYKVSFELKRTVPGAEVSMSPYVPSVEVKGPKPKITKMSVKGSKPFKAKKKRGGRFGLKRLKEKRREELVIEGTPPRLETGGVDVEFAFPRFKQRRRGKVEGEGAAAGGKAKRKIRFPPMKIKTNAGAKPSGKTEIEQVQGHICPSEISGSSLKNREKGHKFGIKFPNTKHPKSSTSLDTEVKKVKPPSVTIMPPSVELNLSVNKDTDKRGMKMNTPDVEFAFPSGQVGMKGRADIKDGKLDAEGRGGLNASVATQKGDTGKGNVELSMPKLKLPSVRLSDEIDGAIKLQAKPMPQNDIPPKPGIPIVEIGLPVANITKVKTEGDLSVKAPSSQLNVLDISLPKVKGKSDINISLSGEKKSGKMTTQIPPIDVSVPSVDLNTRIPDEVESPQISMPKVDFSCPESESFSLDIKSTDSATAKFSHPTFNITMPKAKGVEDVNMTSYVGGDGSFTMPDFEISLPNKSSSKGEISAKETDIQAQLKLPNVDLTLPKCKGIPDNERETYKLPSLDISHPTMKTNKAQFEIQGPEMKGKSEKVDISIKGPEIKGGQLSLPSVDTDLDIQGPQIKGHKFKMPKFDVSLPKVSLPEGNVTMPTLDISLPKANLKGDVNIDGHTGKGGTIDVPSVDLSLPKVEAKGVDVDIQGPELKGDISLPRGELEADLNVEGPNIKGGKFKMPTFDVSLPKVNLPEGHINIKGPEIKGKKNEMPDIDISIPKGKSGGDIEGPEMKGGKFKIPKFDVSLPKVQFPESNIKITGPEFKGKKVDVPDIDVSLPKGKAVGGIEIEGHGSKGDKFQMPSFDISLPKIKGKGPEIETPEIKSGKLDMPSVDVSLPKVKSPVVDISLEGPDIKGGKVNIPAADISLPKGKVEGEINIGGPDVKGGKFKMPKFDVSLPKIGLPKVDANVEGPSMKGDIEMPSVDFSLPKGKTDVELDIDGKTGKGGTFHMPSGDVSFSQIKSKGIDVDFPNIEADVSLPKVKSPEVDVSIKGPEINRGKLPSIEVSMSKENIDTGLDIVGPDIKGNTFKIPKLDVSLPKVNLPEPKVDLDFGLIKSEGDDVEVELLKAEGGRPSSGGSFNFPDVTFKVPSLSLPRFGAKSKSISGKSPEAQNRAPSVEFDKDGKVKVKKPKIKMSVLGAKKNEDVSVSCPDVDIKVKSGKNNSSKTESSEKGPNYKSKHRIKFPMFKISSTKSQQPEEKVNVKLDTNMEGKDGFHGPDVSPGKISDLGEPRVLLDTKAKVKIPSIELSLQGSKTPDTEVLLCKGEVNDPDVEIKGCTEGKLKMPQIKMPDVHVSLPKGKTEIPEVEFKGKGGKYKMMKMPDIDISLPGQKILSEDISQPKEKTKEVIEMKDTEQFKMPNVELYIPKEKGDAGVRSDMEGRNIKLPQIKMPKVDISLPKTKGNLGLVPAIEMGATEGNVKGPHVDREANNKSLQFMSPDLEVSRNESEQDTSACSSFHLETENKGMDFNIDLHGGQGKKDGRNVELSDLKINTAVSSKTIMGSKLKPDAALKVPSIPDIDFDIASEDEDKAETEKKIKIPKFGVPLPYISSPEARLQNYGQEFQYGGPKIPKVKKAVFVLVNPSQTDVPSACTNLLTQKATTTVQDVKMTSVAGNTRVEWGGDSKERGISTSQTLVSPHKCDTTDITGSMSSRNGEQGSGPCKELQEDKKAFSSKIKFPNVEFHSPYTKMTIKKEQTVMKLDSSTGEYKTTKESECAHFTKDAFKDVVSSCARSDLLDTESSDYVGGIAMESKRVQTWSELESQIRDSEEKGDSSCFHVPKFTLKPHSTGFLQITPEGSPRAQRKGEVGGEVDVSGSFCFHTSGQEFTTQLPEEHQASCSKEATVTMVTRTTRITQQQVTAETISDESLVANTETHQLTGDQL